VTSARALTLGVLVALLLPAALYLPALGFGFLYDDGRMVLINRGPTVHLLGSFLERRDDFYRPLFALVMGVQGNLFGLDPVPYHLTNLALHAACSWLVFRIAAGAYGRRAGALAGLLFYGGGTHVEPVVWISGVNALIAPLGALAALAALQRARRAADPRRWCLLALGAWIAGLLAKENGYALPLATGLLLLVQHGRGAAAELGRLRAFVVPALLVMAAFAPFRLVAAPGYRLELGPLVVVRHAVYYAVAVLLPLPDDYRYASDLTAWREAPWLAVLCLASVVPAGLWLRRRRGGLDWSAAAAWSAWSAAIALPALPVLAERQSYLIAAGAAIGGAGLVAPLLSAGRTRLGLGALALVLLFAGQWLALAERVYWWRQAADASSRIVALAVEAAGEPPGGSLALYNVLDRVRFAHVQGVHVCSTIELLSAGRVRRDRCFMTVDPDQGYYPPAEALADARSRVRLGHLPPPARALVYAGPRLVEDGLVAE
jgi:hypothetical protein